MRFGFIGLSLAGLAAAVPSAQPGLKIIARETFPHLVVETTEYIQSVAASSRERLLQDRMRTASRSLETLSVTAAPALRVATFRRPFC